MHSFHITIWGEVVCQIEALLVLPEHLLSNRGIASFTGAFEE